MEQPLQRKIRDCYAVCELAELTLVIRPGPWIRPNLRIATGEVKETNCVKEYKNADKVGLISDFKMNDNMLNENKTRLISPQPIARQVSIQLLRPLGITILGSGTSYRRHSFNIALNPSGYLHQQVDPSDLRSSQQLWNSSIFVNILYFTTSKDRVLGLPILKGERLWTIVILLQ